ncbi:Alpha,alpha-trehalose-phosphate synthase 1 [Hibiscus syriacus]|uniref:alpha,alpha-trehalose-phosphate synthase (UDP-forming) n=1 Tax=Hibiscus syriacus TaxID=106335 RepID=A0A6A3A3P0_HIBSY|nr:alpha,alpha-trehalose-phosphate synthase [UDP-forming] 1-like [Hibiscus syriacus]KAE8697845.1 Alpha,alpha-trehalose-phosphate synthase 1 [Hibiscus syriacus]
MAIASQEMCILHNKSHLALLQTDGMPGSKYKSNIPGRPRTRLERLLRERELRKFSKSFNDELPSSTQDSLEQSDSGTSSGVFHGEDSSEPTSKATASYDGCEHNDPQSTKLRLLVVANRLPVSAIRLGEDSWKLDISVGGLVSALLGVKEFETRWIGWAGLNVPDEIGQKSLTQALAEQRCIPVFLEEETAQQYYNGYCNNILWPLFHYLGLPQEDRLATTRTFQSQFDAYKKANQLFADVVLQHYEEGDVVWCHDYHLMFLPKYLKERNRTMKVGWFLHTPFPSSEIHRTLPSRSELLRSILAADLIGFHTYDYGRHFVSACTRILGLEGTPEGVEDQGKLTRVATFPIGIDSDRFIKALELPEVQYHIKDLKERFAGRKVMLGVDRLDMIKGIPQKILAFEKFLEENPIWRNKVVLVQIAVPTRTNVPEYQKLTSHVHEIVGRINGRFGTLTDVPIHHLDCSLEFHELCALYAVTDVALVTSLRDGMNLVSYEFVACQASKKGVLILSEFAGAAQSLGAGAILVNPWNITEVASSISYALNMPADEREIRHHHNFKHVTSHTSQEWAATFVSELNDTIVESKLRTRQIPQPLPFEVAVERYTHCNNRLIILGLNATLTEPAETLGRKDSQIKELKPKLRPGLHEPLRKLCDDPKTTVLVLSGSRRSVLDDNFGDYSLWLAAENGMFLRSTKGEWITTMPESITTEWVDSVKHVFEYFTERTPRSHFEHRETSLIWNYKYSDLEFGRLQARDVLQHLWTGPISNAALDVVRGSRSVEVRCFGATKGAAMDRILGEVVLQKGMKEPIDYVLCIGHFLPKDEDIYTFFEPEPPSKTPSSPQVPTPIRTSHLRRQRSLSNMEQNTSYSIGEGVLQSRVTDQEGPYVLDLPPDNYFSCTVARERSSSRYLLRSSDEVVELLRELSDHC